MQHAQSDDYVEMIHELQAAHNEIQEVIPMLAFPFVSGMQPGLFCMLLNHSALSEKLQTYNFCSPHLWHALLSGTLNGSHRQSLSSLLSSTLQAMKWMGGHVYAILMQDGSTYLEAAPSGNARDTQPTDCSADPLSYGSASDLAYRPDSEAEADELREDEKAGTELIGSAPNMEPSRGRPQVKPRLRANKSAQQNASLVEGQVHGSDATNKIHLQQQQQQEGVPDEAQDRFTRMLRDNGVTAEELAEGGY